jgi:hypothetical protein
MSEGAQKSASLPGATKPAPRSFAEFLESAPPDTPEIVTGLVSHEVSGAGVRYDTLKRPEIRLYCESERCNGIRVFHSGTSAVLRTDSEYEFLHYVCRNCAESEKTFALLVNKSSETVLKLGEVPAFGPHIPARLITLVGADRELFLKGRRAELRGLGIGAFAYYRRVVEDKKGAIIEEIQKVAARLGAPSETLTLFAVAQAESQFSNAIDKIKAAIPQSLLINGQNPLTLLHSALSEGLHTKSDDDCLELATSIRLVLIELADRIAVALKDEAELKKAVNRLLKK